MNGVNIRLFQFDYDLTWMAFFLDGNDRFYARYGGREDADAESYLTQTSLARVMRAVLRLHRAGQVQTSRYEPKADRIETPEAIPPMTRMLARRKNQCIHCHDVKVAQLAVLRDQGRFRRDQVFTYPPPSVLGLHINRDDQQLVESITPGSAADRADIRSGDRLVEADGQRILTVADLARVLELTPDTARLPVVVERNGQPQRTALQLRPGWKRTPDPSWRASLHFVGPNGGFWGTPLSPAEKQRLSIAKDRLAIRINFFFRGRPEPKRSGLRLGDILIELDGRRKPMTTRQVHGYLQMNKDYGDRVPIVVLRNRKEVPLVLQLPTKPARLE